MYNDYSANHIVSCVVLYPQGNINTTMSFSRENGTSYSFSVQASNGEAVGFALVSQWSILLIFDVIWLSIIGGSDNH